MNTTRDDTLDLRSLRIGDTIEVWDSRDPERHRRWRRAVVTDRQSEGAPSHIPFHVDVQLDNDATTTLKEEDLIVPWARAERPGVTWKVSDYYRIRRATHRRAP